MTGAPTLVLGDRYTLVDRIAAGGMGEVWRARDERLGRVVAVKLLRPEYADDPAFRARFRAEAQHAAKLSHPGIASVYDYGETRDGLAYLVMEHIDGEPLSALLARGGPLSPDRALDVIGQAALALDVAHRAGVIHRDVKPGNLLVRTNPDGRLIVTVTDFGIARATAGTTLTQTGVVLGTARYLSPEQAARRPVTGASDVYALGVVGYECLAGAPPFAGDSPVAIAMAHVHELPPALPATVPEPVRALIGAALRKDPATRPASAAEFGRQALILASTLRRGEPTSQLPPVTAPTAASAHTPTRALVTPSLPGSRRRRHPVLLASAAGLLVLAVVGLPHLLAAGPSHPAAPATPTRSPAPRLVDVVPADYLGQPAATAAAQLRRLGLGVTEITTTGTPSGTVVGVQPSGFLPPGFVVTLQVAAPPPTPPATLPPGTAPTHHKNKRHDN